MADTDYDLGDVLGTFRLDGSMNKVKARIIHEQALDQLYNAVMDADVSISTKVDIAKHLAEVGDLKPKNTPQPQAAGAGFSITINIPQGDGKPPITLTTTQEEIKAIEEAVPEDTPPEKVLTMTIPDFDIDALMGSFDDE